MRDMRSPISARSATARKDEANIPLFQRVASHLQDQEEQAHTVSSKDSRVGRKQVPVPREGKKRKKQRESGKDEERSEKKTTGQSYWDYTSCEQKFTL